MSIRAILRKWYIILICAVLSSGGLYYEKSKVNPVVPKTGEMTYIRVIQFNKVPVFIANQTSTEINVTNLMGTWSNLVDLETQLDEDLDMNRVNLTWSRINDSQKMKWVGEHFFIHNLGPGMYELVVQFPSKDAIDAKYIKENSTKIMDIYQGYFANTSQLVTDDTSLRIIKNTHVINEDKVTSTIIGKKYVVIGFILGALVGIVIVMGLTIRETTK